MGQNRTALILGVRTHAKLDRFLRSDLAHEKFHDAAPCQGMEWNTDTKPNTIGFPVAVAYDPPGGCAELRFPLEIDRIGDNAKLRAAHLRAARKFECLKELLREHGLTLGEPSLFIGEVETA